MTAPAHQPETFTLASSLNLAVGIACNNDRCEIVMSFSAETPLPTDFENLACADLVHGFVSSQLNLLLACLSTETEVTFAAGTGVADGNIPYRADFETGTYPGTRTGSTMPSNVAGLTVFYVDAADLAPTDRTSSARNFIPGISEDDVTGDHISTELNDALTAFSNSLQAGFTGTGDLAVSWWRTIVHKDKNPPHDPLATRRTFANGGRDYVVTQRRRMLPR